LADVVGATDVVDTVGVAGGGHGQGEPGDMRKKHRSFIVA